MCMGCASSQLICTNLCLFFDGSILTNKKFTWKILFCYLQNHYSLGKQSCKKLQVRQARLQNPLQKIHCKIIILYFCHWGTLLTVRLLVEPKDIFNDSVGKGDEIQSTLSKKSRTYSPWHEPYTALTLRKHIIMIHSREKLIGGRMKENHDGYSGY